MRQYDNPQQWPVLYWKKKKRKKKKKKKKKKYLKYHPET
jgi:hypothetical protein